MLARAIRRPIGPESLEQRILADGARATDQQIADNPRGHRSLPAPLADLPARADGAKAAEQLESERRWIVTEALARCCGRRRDVLVGVGLQLPQSAEDHRVTRCER